MTTDGICRIKTQFIDKDYKPRISKYLPADIASDDIKKVRGQNSRPTTDKKGRKANKKLCPNISRSSECSFGEKCKFIHDVEKFIADKPIDISTICYVHSTFGACRHGISCRFSGGHSLPSSDQLIDFFSQERNFIDSDVLFKLSRRKLEFTLADSIVAYIDNQIGIQRSKRNEKRKLEAEDNIISKTRLVSGEEIAPVSCGLNLNETLKQSHDEKAPKSEIERVVVIGHIPDEAIGATRKSALPPVDFNRKLYLAPLTTVGNLPFRRICKEFGADVTCSEMAMASSLLQGNRSEWALVRRHRSEDVFGVQICGAHPDQLARAAEVLCNNCDIDFIDLNVGCPIDLVVDKGAGSGMMSRKPQKFANCVNALVETSNVPVTVKLRAGIKEGVNIAHEYIPMLKSCGVSLITLHGRSRQQRYSKLADWAYTARCAEAAQPVPLYGGGDVLSWSDYKQRIESGVAGVMIGRGALIKPWIFREIKEQRDWDISSAERLEMLQRFTNYGLEHWGSDQQGVNTTRRFLLEWLSFLCRYVPVGILESPPQRINERPPAFVGRDELETLMGSQHVDDWIAISEMLLGPVEDGFTFLPKHKASSYK